MGQNILITGFSGFIGRSLCHQLSKRGAEIVGIGRSSLAPNEVRALGLSRIWVGDVSLSSLTEHGGVPDIIIHCAGGSSVGVSIADPSADFAKSVLATNDLLAFMHARNPNAKLVYASSAAVYGDGHSGPIAEEDAARPTSPYGLHKQICENILQYGARAFGLQVSIVRLFSIYGEGLRRQLLWDACCKISAGQPLFSGVGSEERDWLHVSDAVSLLVRAIDYASPLAPVCNGATGSGVEVRAILGEVAAGLGKGGDVRFDGTRRAGDPYNLVGSVERARKWGWKPEIGWREGVRRYTDWYRNAMA